MGGLYRGIWIIGTKIPINTLLVCIQKFIEENHSIKTPAKIITAFRGVIPALLLITRHQH